MLRILRRALAASRARKPQEPGTANTGLRRRLWRLGWDVHRFDPDLTIEAFVTTVLTTHRINCVIDVGARIGDYGRWLRQIGYQGQIISFEPVAEHVRALTQVAASDGRWTVQPYGLGSVSEARTISVTKSSDFTSLLAPAPTRQPSFQARPLTMRRPWRSVASTSCLRRSRRASQAHGCT